MTFEGPFPAPPQTIGSNPGDVLESAIDNTDINVELTGKAPTPALQALGNNLVETLKPELKMLMKQVAEQVLEPAANAVGADLGMATVTVRSVSVDQPVVYAR
jgi:hypothetical protein